MGVTKDGSRYKAQLSVNGKPKYLGSGTIDECKELYKRAKVSSIEELISVWEHMLPEKVIKQLHLFRSITEKPCEALLFVTVFKNNIPQPLFSKLSSFEKIHI